PAGSFTRVAGCRRLQRVLPQARRLATATGPHPVSTGANRHDASAGAATGHATSALACEQRSGHSFEHHQYKSKCGDGEARLHRLADPCHRRTDCDRHFPAWSACARRLLDVGEVARVDEVVDKTSLRTGPGMDSDDHARKPTGDTLAEDARVGAFEDR